VEASENVGYYHHAHSYVRGNWHNSKTSSPMILAKCSHDMDILQWIIGKKCLKMNSFGSLSYFKEENAPEGSAERCLECKYIDTCTYSAKRIYINRWNYSGKPAFLWPFNNVSLKNPNTEEDLYNGLKTSVLGKCVFKCNVESNPHVVDNQMVQMQFKNGVTAQLRMLFTDDPEGRRVNLFGTQGELVLDGRTGTVEVRRYGKEPEIIKTKDLLEGLKFGYGHAGGDESMINDLYDILTGKKQDYTSLSESLESHLIGVKAEESRLNGGVTLKVHED
jgi:predicted dehydrogenase